MTIDLPCISIGPRYNSRLLPSCRTRSAGGSKPRSKKMYRSLSIAALVLISGCATDQSANGGAAQAAPRIVKQIDLPLTTGGETKTFQSVATQGWVKGSGDWNLRTEVTHTRLRCATYESGIQIGRGNASCSKVEWLTDAEYRTSQTQCNGATRIHSGNGRIDLPRPATESANCVRVVVRCTGAC